jgi:ABC-2 type transport system permease protein
MLREIWIVYRKDMRSYLVSPIPYVLTALFAMYMGFQFFFLQEFFVFDKAEMYRGFFHRLEYPLIALVPAIAMGQWSREVDTGTIETLMTLPVRTSSLVLGKFLSGWTLVLICLLATCSIPITVANLGDLDWGPVQGGYLGAMLVCGAMLALGCWISSLTRHQIVAFVLTIVVGGIFIVMYELADNVGDFFGPIFEQLSLATHYQAMGRGVIDLRDLVYFASFIGFFLYLNVQSVENRRYG